MYCMDKDMYFRVPSGKTQFQTTMDIGDTDSTRTTGTIDSDHHHHLMATDDRQSTLSHFASCPLPPMTGRRRLYYSFLLSWMTAVGLSSVPTLAFCRLPQRSRIVLQRMAASSSSQPPTLQPGDALFGKFLIPSKSIFYRSDSSLAFVNLRPIVPGHVLVIPSRDNCGPLLSDLTDAEYTDMWQTVRTVQGLLKRHYNCTAFNVAVQDGAAAGQTVPHAHVHILPRCEGDVYAGDDAIYQELEEWAPRTRPKVVRMEIPDERRDRTKEEMAEEAALYRKVLEGGEVHESRE
jgi:bis(5'-adenosyl)-triphosphatase